MGMHLTMSAEAGVLWVTASGSFELQDAKHRFIDMLNQVVSLKIPRVFFDGSTLKGEPTLIERFFYGEFAAMSVRPYRDRGVAPWTKFVYLLTVPVLDQGRFGAIVASNRGMHVRIFDDFALAHAWLKA